MWHNLVMLRGLVWWMLKTLESLEPFIDWKSAGPTLRDEFERYKEMMVFDLERRQQRFRERERQREAAFGPVIPPPSPPPNGRHLRVVH